MPPWKSLIRQEDLSCHPPPPPPTSTPLLPANGWGDVFKPKPGEWRCSACSTLNKAEAKEKCASCEEKRPGAAAAAPAAGGAAAAPTFSFGKPSIGSSGFSFGASSASWAAAPSAPSAFGGAPSAPFAFGGAPAGGSSFGFKPAASAEDKDKLDFAAQEKIPEDFVCPVGMDVMTDPVFTSDGHTYERSVIAEWLSNHDTSPRTGAPLEEKTLRPNHALRRLIDGWDQDRVARRGFRCIEMDQLRLDVRRDTSTTLSMEERLAAPLCGAATTAERKRARMGAGQDKTVYRGFWGGRSVAMLCIRKGRCDTEAGIFTLLGRHPHLITYFGTAQDPGGLECMVVELAPLGSLDKVLDDRREVVQDASALRSLQLGAMTQVCSGMMSVAAADLVHRDLALHNVMVCNFDVDTGKVLVKVSDFGLTREGTYYCGGDAAIPVRWTAPEALRNRRRFSEKSDVWSFGVLVWELLDLADHMPFWQFVNDDELLVQIAEGRATLACPPTGDAELWRIAADCCLAHEPKSRLTFAQLHVKLRELQIAQAVSVHIEAEWVQLQRRRAGEAEAIVDRAKQRAVGEETALVEFFQDIGGQKAPDFVFELPLSMPFTEVKTLVATFHGFPEDDFDLLARLGMNYASKLSDMNGTFRQASIQDVFGKVYREKIAVHPGAVFGFATDGPNHCPKCGTRSSLTYSRSQEHLPRFGNTESTTDRWFATYGGTPQYVLACKGNRRQCGNCWIKELGQEWERGVG